MNQWHNDLAEYLSLDGDWACSLNRQHSTLHVPGTWEAQGFDRRVEGPAILSRTIHTPSEWHSRPIQLQFDAVSYFAEVQVNGMPVGTHTGMWSPFAFDVADALKPGMENTISLTVWKPGERFPLRESLAGFLPDVALPFGGLWQSARLVAFADAALSDIAIRCDTESGKITLQAQPHRAAGLKAVVRVHAPGERLVATWEFSVTDEPLVASLTIPQPELWTPDHPALYTVEIALEGDDSVRAKVTRTVGFRSLMRAREQVLLDGVPICLRGVLNWGWYPDILCPAPDEATIRDEFRRVRSMGYNMVKLCLYVPSPLYFQIADEEGMLLWLELPMWLPQATPHLREQAPLEYAAILDAVHHHPSIVVYSLGCELDRAVDADLLGQLNGILRSQVSGALACDNSGSGEAYGGLAFDYADFNDYHFYCDLHYFNPLVDHFSRDWQPPRPWIFGEFCDADDYRDLSDISAAYGGQLPWWLTEPNPIHPPGKLAYALQQQRVRELALPFDEAALKRISRQQSLVVRKTILEKVRSRAGMGGYVVTGLRDTPLATSSMFDDLGRAKYDAETFRTFNADAVLCLEQGRARLWKHGGDRPAPVDLLNRRAGEEISFRVVLANAGKTLPGGELRWQLLAPDGRVHTQRTCTTPTPLLGGNPREIARIQFTAPEVETAGNYTLTVELDGHIHNQWSLWIYPPVIEWQYRLILYDPAGCLNGLDDLLESAQRVSYSSSFPNGSGRILITSVLTPEVHRYIERGGSAILLQVGNGGLPAQPCPFWREAIKLIYPHPIMDAFPHQGFADLQFYHLAADFALNTGRLQADISGIVEAAPIIRRLDARLFTVLDYLVELRLGGGRLLASTLHFAGGAGDQVSSLAYNVAGRFLLDRMLHYLSKQV